MASLLSWGRKLYEQITPQNEETIRRSNASIQNANQKIQALGSRSKGVLARPQQRQVFTRTQQPERFDFRQAAAQALQDTLTRPELITPKINVGNFRGSGLIEDFANSPFKQARGIVQLGNNQVKQGLGNLVTGTVEGPAGLLPVGKVAQAGRGARLLPKVLAGTKVGAREGAVYGATYGGGQAASQNQSNKNVALQTLLGGAIGGGGGAVFGGAVPLAGAGAKASKQVIDNRVPLNQVGAVGKNVKKAVPKLAEDLKPAYPYTPAPKSPNAFARSWQTVNGVISQHGTGGKELAERIAKARNVSEISQQAFLSKIPSVTKLKKDFPTFVETLEKLSKGGKVSVPPNIQQAINEWNAAIPEIRQRATQAGLDVGDLGENYFPRQYKDLFDSDKRMGEVAKQMVESGKAKDLGDAMGKLRYMKNEYQRPFGNLEKTRELDLPGYEMTPEAMTNYVSRAFERITKAEQLGSKNEILNSLQAKMQQEGYNATPGSTVDKYIRIALGDVDKSTTGHKVSGTVRKLNALRSLSTAGISNATQLPVNTSTVAGFGRTLTGIGKSMVSPKARAEAKQTGVLLDHAIQNLSQQQLGTTGKLTRAVASPFFRQVEKFNRQATAIVGKDYGNSLAKKGKIDVLRDKFGVEGKIGKQLTREQEIQVSRKLVELTQFKVDPMDLPGWVDSPMGKLAAQFRSFGYKQTDFMYNQVLREATKGNFAPLARFVAIAVPAGVSSLKVKGNIKGVDYTEDDESNVSKGLKGIAAVGGFGLPGDTAQQLYKGNQYDNLTGAIAGAVGGPTVSFGAELSENLGKSLKGNSRPLSKQGVRSIPAVGPSIANRVFPKKEMVKAVSQDKLANASPEQIEATAKAEKQALKSSAGSFTLQKLSDGKYAYTLEGDNDVHTAKSLKDARQAVAKAGFKNEEGSYKIIGEKVYRKNADGDVSVITKDSFDYQLGTATLTSQKRAGDLDGWMKTANSQLDLIEKQLKDPNIDPLEKIKLENQADALIEQAQKYQSYGGFKKGKSGRGGRSGRGSKGTGALTSSFKTASSSKISPPKGVKVSVPKASFKSSKGKKYAVNKIPYTKRRLA